MRPVLLDLPHGPTWLLITALLVAGIVIAGVWLAWLRRRGALTRDHLYTAAAALVMAGIILVILHQVGSVRVNSYGAMLMVGFVIGTLSGVHLGRRRGVPAERLLDLGLIILVGSIIGARLMYVLLTPNAGPIIDIHTILKSGLGGLSFHGGLIGGLLTASIYIAITKLSFWRVADTIAPAVAVGYAITRIGCFLNGCCYGKPAPAWLPWRMTFPLSPDGCIRDVHPSQLYASLMGFAMFGILLWLSRGNSLGRAGRLFMAFLMLEGVERFVMEIFRFDPHPFVHFSGSTFTLALAQVVSLLIIVIGIIGWRLLPKQPAVDETPVPPDDHKRRTAPSR